MQNYGVWENLLLVRSAAEEAEKIMQESVSHAEAEEALESVVETLATVLPELENLQEQGGLATIRNQLPKYR